MAPQPSTTSPPWGQETACPVAARKAGAEARSRDAFNDLPLLPLGVELGRTGPEPRENRQKEAAVRRLANRSILAIRAMWAGNFGSHRIECVEGRRTSWDSATPHQRELARRILAAHRSFCAPDSMPCGEGAFRRLTQCSPSGYGNEGTTAPEGVGNLPRGALCPLVVDELAVPGTSRPPLDPAQYSSSVRAYYEDALHRIVKPRALVDWERYHSIKPYQDPALRQPAVLLQMLARLWSARMLTFCSEHEESVNLFTVVKKHVEQDGRQRRVSRLV